MREIRILFLLIIAVSIVGCGKFRKIQKSGDWKVKYEAALAYYEEEDYHRSIMLLEDILPIIRGTEEAELGNFYLAYSYFHQKQYILSAHHFSEFVKIYGRSEYVMEASYMNAYSLYLQSPDYQLDQTVTYEAIAAMQNFINRYPTSDYASDADRIIDDMQQKLEKKAYEQCKLYYKLRRYKSALVVYQNFANDFPDSHYNEEVSYLRIETSYDYARESIRSRQKERYQNAIDHYLAFIDKYPNSKYLKDAERIYDESIKEITKFADSN
ncbi:Beta-barrel assembly machine subunit BamD [Ekhidna lutea]|uniref:Beta-barrel assembly machine subunit BamD n=1 Tax=Ekhidna lutea TaxID=447679 RepID=A0A239M565_EKHLU|nr:outer membrane protein assembly factor BamD [Ekhidna lutea]SNT37650.1 Beta-barrel assembly machine subunit BamD [Ekhidna lutea]